MSAVCVMVEWEVAEGKFEAFESIMNEHARITRQTESGCDRFDIIRVVDASGSVDRKRLVLYEVYRDPEAYALHSQQPRLSAMRESYANLITGRRVLKGMIGT